MSAGDIIRNPDALFPGVEYRHTVTNVLGEDSPVFVVRERNGEHWTVDRKDGQLPQIGDGWCLLSRSCWQGIEIVSVPVSEA